MPRRTLSLRLRPLHVILLSLLPGAALGQNPDAGSLRVVKATPSAVRLTWTSPSPTAYCVSRDATPSPVTIIAEAPGLSHVDDPPTAPGQPALWYYDVSEAPATGCFGGGSPCTPVTSLACGVPFAGDTSAGCAAGTSDWTGCAATGLTGPECAHSFTAASSGDWSVTLSGMTADLDVVVIAGAASCDPGACVAAGDAGATFAAVAGESFTIIVDGRGGASGTYTLTVDCAPTTRTCVPAAGVACGDRLLGDTAAPGSADAISNYAGCSATGLDGREIVYSFSPVADDFVSIGLLQGSAALDLVILRDDGGGCDPDATCLAFEDSEARLGVVAGATYYIVVDGASGVPGSHELALACASSQCVSLGSVVCGALRQDDNANSGVSAMDAYACTAFDESGPEYIYEFIAAQDGDMTVTLTGLGAELDIIVMEDVLGCQADSCIAFGDSSVTFPITAGTRYHVAIEGRAGASGNYTATFACSVPPQDCVPAGNVDCATAAFSNNGAVGSTDAVDSYPSCIDWDESGNEFVYQWIAPSDVTALVSLSDLTADLDIFVLAESGQGCSVSDCIAHGDDFATFDAVAGRLYFFAVDGRAGARGDFRLHVDCFPAPGGCRELQPLRCGESVSGNNAQPGSTDAIDQWVGCTPFVEDGPEVAYEFSPTADAVLDLSLSGLSAELDLFVLRDSGSGCTSADCVAAGDSAVSLPVVAGERYFLVVDGRNGAVGDFTLSLACR